MGARGNIGVRDNRTGSLVFVMISELELIPRVCSPETETKAIEEAQRDKLHNAQDHHIVNMFTVDLHSLIVDQALRKVGGGG
jgi:hypothetical protein